MNELIVVFLCQNKIRGAFWPGVAIVFPSAIILMS